MKKILSLTQRKALKYGQLIRVARGTKASLGGLRWNLYRQIVTTNDPNKTLVQEAVRRINLIQELLTDLEELIRKIPYTSLRSDNDY